MRNRKTKSLVVMLAFVVAMLSSRSTQAQTFKKVNVQHRAKMAQIASGGASVWGLDTNGHPYIFKGASFVQASTISLAQIAVGGGSTRQPDAVWAVDWAYNIYHVVKSGTTYLFNQIPGSLDTIAVGIGYQDGCHPYEVWGLNYAAEIWRFDFCKNNWDQIWGSLQTLAVSGGDVWGINGNGDLYVFDYGTLGFQQANSGALQVAVEPQGVWMLSQESGHTYVEQIGGNGYSARACCGASSLTQIQAGDGVWGVNASGEVFVLRYAQFEFVQIPGAVLASVSVGAGTGVWGIDFSGQVWAFSTP
ncbi:MAG TPA: tectonin domain-containing protein [Candidatus Sulfotelmatobacter sp.]|nr:tectonin domain-containing protein [Candidatus Sulfotelmatobacter sp.]